MATGRLGRNVYASDKSELCCVHSQDEARVCYCSEGVCITIFLINTCICVNVWQHE